MGVMLYLLMLCVYHEARGEPLEAQVAVAQVVMNRMEQRGEDVSSVLFAPHQFSWAGKDGCKDINILLLLKVSNSVYEAIRRRGIGDTYGEYNHFYSTDIEAPIWAIGMGSKEQIGSIVFLSSYKVK